jgi:hypothetical protein
MKIKTLRVGDIRLDFQSPENLIEDQVLEYVKRISRGDKLSPVRVRFDGKHYFCEDGFHRLEAARRTGLLKIQAGVFRGTLLQMEANFKKYLKRLKQHLAGGE